MLSEGNPSLFFRSFKKRQTPDPVLQNAAPAFLAPGDLGRVSTADSGSDPTSPAAGPRSPGPPASGIHTLPGRGQSHRGASGGTGRPQTSGTFPWCCDTAPEAESHTMELHVRLSPRAGPRVSRRTQRKSSEGSSQITQARARTHMHTNTLSLGKRPLPSSPLTLTQSTARPALLTQ